jgi:A/G-specific adenine glycosylase
MLKTNIMNKKERDFVTTVWNYYDTNKRDWLLWRGTTDPYHILVSEVMCQQTQVERVVPKYRDFLKRFSTVDRLSNAPLGEVLRLWQGLGYNRRAKMLHACAKEVVRTHESTFPKDVDALRRLPGIGPYTAGAVMVFAFNKPIPLIETNIRSVYLHHFFKNENDISDHKIQTRVEATMDSNNPREWFSALMDYGSYVKKEFGNQNGRSKSYIKQSPFSGSERQVRGAIIRLLAEGRRTQYALLRALPFEKERVQAQAERLLQEGMVEKRGPSYQLPR